MPSNSYRNCIYTTLLALAVIAFSGCGSYQAGHSQNQQIRSVYIEPVINNSNEPQVVAPLSRALREAFIRGSNVSLANSADTADAVLYITLAGSNQQQQSYRSSDTGIPISLRWTLQADVELLIRNSDGNSPKTTQFSIEEGTTIYTEPSVAESRSQAISPLLERMAERIRDRVLL